MKLDKYIAAFAGKDERRPILMDVVHDAAHQCVVATNGQMLVVAPEHYHSMEDVLPMPEKYPKYRDAIPASGGVNKDTIYIDPKKIVELYAPLEKKHIYAKCGRCEGDGRLYTKNYKSVKCDRCEGEGTDEFLYYGVPQPADSDVSTVFSFQQVFFNPNHLYAIALLAIAAGVNIAVSVLRPGSTSKLMLGDICVVVGSMDGHVWEGNVTKIEVPKMQGDGTER